MTKRKTLLLLYFCLMTLIVHSQNVSFQKSKDAILLELKNSLINQKPPLEALYQQQIYNGFEKAFQICLETEKYFFYSDTLEINLFKQGGKYVFIRFKAEDYSTRFGFFKITDDDIEKIFLKEEGMGYSQDTIQDVNGDGDGYFDVLTSFYSPVGCCLRNYVTIRLYNPDSLAFRPPVSIMNPTFFPDKKVFYSISYGHPGQISITKYSWNALGYQINEMIFLFKKGKGNFINI